MASTVWYLGKGERIISSAAWNDYLITAEDTVWNAENGWAVPTADLTEDQLNVLDTMRDQFRLDQEGLRTWPAPNGIKDYQDSAFIYYAKMVDLYEGLFDVETGPQGPKGDKGDTGDTGPQGARGTRWYTGTGEPGTIVGSTGGDIYLDLSTGQIYTLS